MSLEILVKPLGLVTQPNQYGQYPIGALSVAQDVVMRSPGILESAPSFITTSFGAANDVYDQLFPLKSGRVMEWVHNAALAAAVYIDTVACTLPSGFTATSLFSITGRTQPVRARDRILFSSAQGQLVLDSESPALPAALRSQGIAQPIVTSAIGVAGAAYTTATMSAGYAVVIRRVFADGYEIESVPSPVYCYPGGTANADCQVIVYLPVDIVAGDLVELYRTPNAEKPAAANVDPGAALYLVQTKTYASGANIAFTDKQLFGGLGETNGRALYTNPGQEGALAADRQPNVAQCNAMFANYRFIGNVTSRPQAILKAYGGVTSFVQPGDPDEAVARARLVGGRAFAGTATSGNPTITAIPAGQTVGIVAGQRMSDRGGKFSTGNPKVLSTTATTITFDTNATASGASTFATVDVIEINGTEWYVAFGAGNTGNALGESQRYEITANQTVGFVTPPSLSTGLTLTIEPSRFVQATQLSIRATNGALYDPVLPEITLTPKVFSQTTIKNSINWSKDSQPEHFPAASEGRVGNSEIIAFASTRDALWIFCTDGLFRLSGAAGQWRVDTVDTTCILSSPRAATVMREVVYAYTNMGLVRITDSGVEPLSERVIADLLPGSEYAETASIIVSTNEAHNEVLVRIDATQVFVYNVQENAFTTLVLASVTAMAYHRYASPPTAVFAATLAGLSPTNFYWDSSFLWRGASVRFQSIFGQDPFGAKQWIDAVYVFDAASNGKAITPFWNGVAATASALKGAAAQFFNESRALFGVPRRAAVGNTLAAGFTAAANLTTPTKLYALSLRYRQFGEQHLHR